MMPAMLRDAVDEALALLAAAGVQGRIVWRDAAGAVVVSDITPPGSSERVRGPAAAHGLVPAELDAPLGARPANLPASPGPEVRASADPVLEALEAPGLVVSGSPRTP